MFAKILVAYDGSAGSERALAAAVQIARSQRADLWGLAVEDRLPRLAATVGEMEEEKELAGQFYKDHLEDARVLAADSGVALHAVVRPGHAAQTITEFAKEEGFDLIVLGHSGHSGVWANFLGTTTEKVSRHAPCSVLIVR